MEKDKNIQRIEQKDIAERVVYYEEDEIDLYELWLTLKRRYKLLVSVMFSFILLSIVYLFLAKPVYKTEFIVKLPKGLTSPQETRDIIQNLENLRKENRYTELSNLLSISEEDVMEIDSISASEIKKNKNIVKITLNVYDPIIIEKLGISLLEYLNNNRFVKERIRLKRETLRFLINETNKKIKEIESVKDRIVEDLKRGKIRDIGFNPVDMDRSILSLKERVKNLENQLKLLRGYEIAVNPVVPEKPSKPKKTLILAVSLVSGLFLGIFLVFFVEWIENAKRNRGESL
jgi:capsular polysaccharide biosynthesis protein